MRLSDLRFLLALVLPLSAIVGVLTMPHLSAAFTLAFWTSMALLEVFLPGGKTSPAAIDVGADSAYFRWILRLFVLLQLSLIGLAAYAAVHSSWLTALGLTFAVGYVTGAQGITFAH